MNKINIYQIDTFANKIFHGNPAAVCPLEHWLDDVTLQAIAQENNLAETAFFIPADDGFHIRWFTPTQEVPLCGHATLACAFVIFTELEPERQSVQFESKSGPLKVTQKGSMFEMNFPSFLMMPCQQQPENLLNGLKVQPQEVFVVEADPNYYAILATEDEVRAIEPDLYLLEQLHPYGVIVTAPGIQSDCVSRCFAPSYGIPEDPVTGSIHSALVPYWANRLKKEEIHAHQASPRGGDLFCKYQGDRVLIRGNAVKYLTGNIYV
ncbi:MAG: PhzF family phenazine biosynthesis protein [Desulfobacteraceae bacterium]|nr:PhzF family phenazine biosynthesis protein [Desulfobacteraceae bacterium]